MPKLAGIIDGMLRDSQEHYQDLREAKPRPHVLDDYTVNRVARVFSDQAKMLVIYDQQLDRWQKLSLGVDQASEVERLKGQLGRIQALNGDVLALAEELKQGTIDRVLEKSDAEVRLEFLRKLNF